MIRRSASATVRASIESTMSTTNSGPEAADSLAMRLRFPVGRAEVSSLPVSLRMVRPRAMSPNVRFTTKRIVANGTLL